MLSKMIDQFEDEVSGANEYLDCAAGDKTHAAMYNQMAQAEAEHARMLKDAIDQECSATRTPEQAQECLASLLDSVRSMTASQLASLQARM